MEENKNLEVKREDVNLRITYAETSNRNMGIWDNMQSFESAQRMAKALSTSTLTPKDYQGNIGNCLIALDMSTRLQMAPTAVMQNLYIVNGRPSWSSQFITAIINNSRRYRKPLMFDVKGKGKDLSCIAWTEDHEGNRVEGIEITMKMAEDENWVSKNGSKWKTMPELMIRYRAASFFGRLHCPDLIMGVYSDDEVRDFTDKSGKADKPKHEVPSISFDKPTEVTTEPRNEVVDVEFTEEQQADMFAGTPLGYEEE